MLTAQNGRALVEQIADAMGGVNQVLAVKTLTLRGSGENYNFGQNLTPDSELPLYTVTKFIRVIDFANARWRQDQTREPKFLTANITPQRQRTGLDSVAYDITSDTTMRRLADRPTIDRRAELLYHPIGFIQAALQRGAHIVQERQRGAIRKVHLDVNGDRYTMTVDARTLLPIQIDRKIPNGMLGDVLLSNEFPKWYAASDVRVPVEIVQRIDDRWKLSDIQLDGVKVNGDVGDITIPASVKIASLVTLPINVTVDSIARGVWLIGGGSHNSVAIALKDQMLLVEAPQSDERTLAVIKRVRMIDSTRPLTTVINTHHHFDHAGGLRAAVSEGLTVITQTDNVSFLQDLMTRKFTLSPDQLSKSPRKATIEGVTSHRTLTDGTRSIELYEVSGSMHSGSMLIVYLPAEKILIEADLYTPPATNVTTPVLMPFIANLSDNLTRLGLQVETIIPIHGRVVTMHDFTSALATTLH